MSLQSVAPVVGRSLAWMGRGLVLGVAAIGLVIGGVVGQIIVAYALG